MISLDINNGIANILIDDGRANVITKQIADDFIAALDTAKESAKATVVRGGGDKFSAGFDLQTIQTSGQAQIDMVTAGFNLLYQLYAHPLPLIAACNGHAIGLGAFILLCCDTRIGADHDYKIGLPETAAGMPFTPLLVTILREELPRSVFKQAALQSQMWSPKQAVEAGFLDTLVDSNMLDTSAQQAASQLTQLPLTQYSENKQLLRAFALSQIKSELHKIGV